MSPSPLKQKHNLAGHREKFPDGTYICMGSFGHVRSRAETTAANMEQRYNYQTKITEKSARVKGERGFVKKSLYLIWVKAK